MKKKGKRGFLRAEKRDCDLGGLSAFSKITLNGKNGGATNWIHALNDARIVQEKAGFLFKATFDGDHLMLAVAPTLIQGERSYHYNMHLKKEDSFTLLGDVDAQGVFTILFNPESRAQIQTDAEKYIELFRRFAAFLVDNGYTGNGRLDEVTQRLLKNLGLSPAPETLAGLVKSRRSES